jgi:hypothetical protein
MKHIKTTSRVAPANVETLIGVYCKAIDILGAPDVLGKCGNDE